MFVGVLKPTCLHQYQATPSLLCVHVYMCAHVYVFMCVWASEGACFLTEVAHSEKQSLSWSFTSLGHLDCPEKNKGDQVSIHMNCHTQQGRAGQGRFPQL